MLLLLALISFAQSFTILPRFNISLDGPPKARWQPAVKYFLQTHGFENSFGAVFKHHNSTVFARLTPAHYQTLTTAIKTHFAVYAEELEGVYELLAPYGVSYEYLAAWAYFHEISHSLQIKIPECTGILYQVGEQVIHGRNQDQQPPQGRNLVAHLKFYKNSVLIGEAVDWYWFKTGLITAIKFNVVSMEENWRDGNYQSLDSVLKQISRGYGSLTWSFRAVLERDDLDTFEKVLYYLENVPQACSLYNVIAGPQKNQGAIITRDPMKRLKSLRLGSDADTFLVQTNYDHWEADPESDDRRTVAENLLAKISPQLQNELGIYSVLNTYPVHNEWTFYTTISIMSQNKYWVFGQRGIAVSEEIQHLE